MKLLPKSELLQRKSDAKKMEIDEGVRLARKIDALRDTYNEEEKSLNKFRTETVSRIHQEISTEREKLSNLQKEVIELSDQRAELLIPLDKEWDELRMAQEELKASQKAIEHEWSQILKSEQDIKYRNQEIAKTLSRALSFEKKHAEILKNTEDVNKLANAEFQESVQIKERMEKLYEDMIKELRKRDSDLASKERDYIMKEAKLTKRESELENGWKILNDRKETFERTINRLKKP